MAIGGNKIVVRLGLEGLVGFRKKLYDASKAMRKAGMNMKRNGEEISKMVTLPVVGIGIAAIKTAADFEASMNKVSAISGATGADFEKLKKQARDLGGSTVFSAKQAAEGMTFLSMAGFDVNQVYSAMPATLNLAAAGNIELAAAADIASNVLTGFGLEAEKLTDVVDVMAKQATTSNTDIQQLGDAFSFAAPGAAALGVNVNETAAAIGALSDAGIQGQRAGRGFRIVLTELNKKASELPFAVKDASGQMLPFTEILKNAEAAGYSGADAMNDFSANAGTSMAALLKKGSAALSEQIALLEEAGGTAEKIANKQLEGFYGQLKQLRSAAEELMITIADSGLLAAVTDLAKRATDVARSLSETNPKLLKTITVIAGLAAAIGPLLIVLGQAKIAMAALGFTMKGLIAMNPTFAIVGLAAAIGTAIYGLTQFNDTIDVTAEKTKALDDVRKSAMNSIANEIFKIENLTKVAKSENISKEERIRAIKELQKISPKYNDVIDGERINVEKLTTATDELTDSMLNQAMVMAAQSQFEELGAELIKLQSGVKQVGLSLSEKAVITVGKMFGTSFQKAALEVKAAEEATNNQANAIQAVQAKMESLKTFIDENKKMFGGMFDEPKGDGGGGGGGGGGDGDGVLFTFEESLEKIKKLFNSAPMQLINDFVMGWHKGRVTLTETIVSPFRDAFDLPTSIGITETFKKTRDKIKSYFDSGAFDFINQAVFGVGQIQADEEGNQEGDEMPEWMGKVQEYAAMAQQALGGLFDFWGQSIANRREKMNQYYDEEIAKIEASAMTEKKKEEAITKLNEERAKKERKLAREEAKRNKAAALFQAIIQGALAVVSALNSPGGVIMAAIVGGIAAAQIAAIAAEPLPALAEGGLAYGPTMALVGDNTGARVDPEVISPLSKLKDIMGGQQDIRLSGAFRIQGQDLVLALEEANQIRVRR